MGKIIYVGKEKCLKCEQPTEIEGICSKCLIAMIANSTKDIPVAKGEEPRITQEALRWKADY